MAVYRYRASRIEAYTNVDNDDTNAAALTMAFGTCYVVDNAGILDELPVDLELPTQTAQDKGKSVWVRSRYTQDPQAWDPVDSGWFPIAAIKPTGGDTILHGGPNGPTLTSVEMSVNNDNLRFEAIGNGEWILG